MYWIGFYNSGKGIGSNGSWTSLPDREWKTNGKFDTALYELDVNTGECTRVAKVPNRCSFSAIWIDGDDPSEGSSIEAGVNTAAAESQDGPAEYFNLMGQPVDGSAPGIYIVKQNGSARKAVVR